MKPHAFTAGLAVCLLAALVLLQPVVARASQTEAVAAPAEPSGWQYQMHERVKQHQLGWIIPSAIFDGGGRAVWWSLGASEGPWVLPVVIGVQTIEGCGVLASQSTLKLIHKRIDRERSALHLARNLEKAGWTWFGVWMGSLALGWTLYGLYTAVWGPGLLIWAIASWLVVFPFLHPAITNWAVASDARRVANGHTYAGDERPRNRKVRPEVKAASPLGFVLVW